MVIYPIAPVPKPRQTQRDKWMKRPCVLRYRAFADKVRLHRVKLPQPCSVVFWLPMPKSWDHRKRVGFEGQPHTVKPDLDNLLKALGDAVHAEDSHLWSVAAEKRWTSGKPRIEVECAALEDACRVCGCTEDDCTECVAKTGEPCSWVSPGLCSACADDLAEDARDTFGLGALAHSAQEAQASGGGNFASSHRKANEMATTRKVKPKARATASAPKKSKGRSAVGKGKGAAKSKPRKPRKAKGAASSEE
jgi:Holliday junction resolvase RusA-like endonuclease